MAIEKKFVVENMKRVLLKEYIREQTEHAGFGGMQIQRTPMGTRVTLYVERPGLVIGRKGETIKNLTELMKQKFDLKDPQIEVEQVKDPEVNPLIMAEKIANWLERGWHFRRVGHSTVRRIMRAGARGCMIRISGKLTGDRARAEKFRDGTIKYCGEPRYQWMRVGRAIAKLKPGIIGVTVWIMDPEAKLPDEINIIEEGEIVEGEKAAREEEYVPEAVEAKVVGEGAVEVKEHIERIEGDVPEISTAGAEARGEVEAKAEIEEGGGLSKVEKSEKKKVKARKAAEKKRKKERVLRKKEEAKPKRKVRVVKKSEVTVTSVIVMDRKKGAEKAGEEKSGKEEVGGKGKESDMNTKKHEEKDEKKKG